MLIRATQWSSQGLTHFVLYTSYWCVTVTSINVYVVSNHIASHSFDISEKSWKFASKLINVWTLLNWPDLPCLRRHKIPDSPNLCLNIFYIPCIEAIEHCRFFGWFNVFFPLMGLSHFKTFYDDKKRKKNIFILHRTKPLINCKLKYKIK